MVADVGVIAGIVLSSGLIGLLVYLRRRRQAPALAREALRRTRALRDRPRDDYLRASEVRAWKASDEGPRISLRSWQQGALPEEFPTGELEDALEILADPEGWARKRNETYVRGKAMELSSWFENRFPVALTEAQRRAVVTDQDSNLVVAGAGCGKTAVMVAKLAYLVEQRGVAPHEILVLAFNRSVAEEVRGRLETLGIQEPEVATFHAKGFELLGRAGGRKPAVSSLAADSRALLDLLQTHFGTLLRDRAFRKRFSKWWVDLRVDASDLKESETPDERLRRERSLGLRTLDGTQVQSQSEVKVGDWLTLHGVEWEHEKRYPHHEGDPDFRDYTPDFHLPEHEVWIEVWACDTSEKRFPPEIPEERYREGMEWKRELHAAKGTILVEVFQDEIWKGRLDKSLRKKLETAGVDRSPLTTDEVDGLLDRVGGNVHPFITLLGAFLRLYRAGGWTRQQLTQRARSRRDRVFLEIFWPFLIRYEEALEAEGKIDFDAMLIEAAKALEDGSVRAGYRYIMVDEFQDTSRARLELIRQLRRQQPGCRVFLVGDDWQSIYRFTGSDVSYFTSVEQYLGTTERTDLDKTFRLESDVTELSAHFVTRNPSQLKKRLEPRAESHAGGVVVHFHRAEDELETLASIVEHLEVDADGDGARLPMLARYNHRLEPFDELERVLPGGLEGRALTVHRAKGLEADHVIVVGLDSGTYGFPSEIEDDRVVEMLLGDGERFPNAEERRLFYVALTRTRSRVHLLANTNEPSPFIQELISEEYASWVDLFGEKSARYRCPRCSGKTIRRRQGKYGDFWGCINYSACRGRLSVCPACRTGVIEPRGTGIKPERYGCTSCGRETSVCPACRTGALLQREGKHGPFLGCSEWRRDGSGCGYTEDD